MEQFAALRIKELSAKAWYTKVSEYAMISKPDYISAEVKYRWYGRSGEVAGISYEICLQWKGACKIWRSEDYENCFNQMVDFIIVNFIIL